MRAAVGGRCSGWATTALEGCLCGMPHAHIRAVAVVRPRQWDRRREPCYGFATQITSRRSKPRPPAAVLNGTEVDLGDRGGGGGPYDGVGQIEDVELRSEAEQSYLSYAMSVIVGRALPDVRDGLKPVHRRILYAMHELGMDSSKPHRKCARVVGEVLGKYHPHGDMSVYDALVRLAQDFSMRLPLIAGHGNFGSLDNDPAAAMRYTECRLQASTQGIMLDDIAFNTVNFLPNFDNSLEEPTVLPARIPNLLVNGTHGIAVGIATKIPPHNLGEVVAGLCALIRNPDISIAELMQHIPAPDFPTGGEILASEGIAQAYATGRGAIKVRGRLSIEDPEDAASPRAATRRGGPRRGAAGTPARRTPSSGKTLIVITELPYQVNKARWVEQVVALVDAGTLTGISDVRDESDRNGVRLVVEVKKGMNTEVVLNGLYKHTQLQVQFSCNMVALVGRNPIMLNLKDFLKHFLDFRCDVVQRRARFELDRAEKRKHIVEGLLMAMSRMDALVVAIRAAPDAAAAGEALRNDFGLSQIQANEVLGMPLRRLTSLERGKLEKEEAELAGSIAKLSSLLASPAQVLEVVEAESLEAARRFGDTRRSLVRADVDGKLVAEDVIPNRESLLVYSRRGYIKRMQTDLFAAQGRGGRGKTGTRLRDDDTMEEVLHIHDHDHVLFFTPDGVVRSVRAHQIPEASRTASGTAITQVLPISKDTSIAALLSVSEFREDECLVLLTRHGVIKKTPIQQFQGLRASGIMAIKLNEGDELVWVNRCAARDGVLLGSCNGQVIMFPTDDDQLRPMARSARGVRAMKLAPGARLVGMAILRAVRDTSPDIADDVEEEEDDPGRDPDVDEGPHGGEGHTGGMADTGLPEGPCVLLVTQQGLGKRVPVSEFRLQGRGGMGLRGLRLNPGDELAALHVVDTEGEEGGDVLLGSTGGLMTRTQLRNIPRQSRAARGVGVLRLLPDDTVQSVTLLPSAEPPLPQF